MKNRKYNPQGYDVIYPALGLCGEAGEVAEKVKKVFRDKRGKFSQEDKDAIVKELGDTLWYVACVAYDLGIDLNTVAKVQVLKAKDREKRGVVRGSGDNR